MLGVGGCGQEYTNIFDMFIRNISLLKCKHKHTLSPLREELKYFLFISFNVGAYRLLQFGVA